MNRWCLRTGTQELIPVHSLSGEPAVLTKG